MTAPTETGQEPAEAAVEAPLTVAQVSARLVAVAAVQAHLKTIESDLKAQAISLMETGDRKTAALDPADPKATKLGTVSRENGSTLAVIRNAMAFEAWVGEEHPEEFETVTRPKTSFVSAVLKSVIDFGGYPDTESGEIADVPGVEVTTGTDRIVVRKDPKAVERVRAALASGGLRELAQ